MMQLCKHKFRWCFLLYLEERDAYLLTDVLKENI